MRQLDLNLYNFGPEELLLVGLEENPRVGKLVLNKFLANSTKYCIQPNQVTKILVILQHFLGLNQLLQF
jgi:hypothetical protein